MKLLSWPARYVFALPWPCLLTRGPSYLPGVNDWGRENKPPPAAPSTIGCLPGVAVASWGGSRDRMVAGWVPAGPQLPGSCSSRIPPAPRDQAVLPHSQDKPGMWQIWGEGTTGELSPFSGRSPPVAIGSGLSWRAKEATRVVPATQLGSWTTGREMQPYFELSLGCPRKAHDPGRGD